jgi:ATP-GRASP peptide maturase of grasp-with-spasm system
MIGILSQAWDEPTTEAVMEWLRAWDVSHVRINASDVERPGALRVSIGGKGAGARLRLGDSEIDPASMTVAWYRRWDYKAKFKQAHIFVDPADETLENIGSSRYHLNGELQTFSRFFFSLFSNAHWLGDPFDSAPNKLEILVAAAQEGFDIPDTCICTDTESVRQYIADHGEAVTKPIKDMLLCTFEDTWAMSYTSAVKPEALEGPTAWRGGFPTCFQEALSKKYEVRTFYIDGECYSMALFSQRDDATKVDSRRHEYGRATRVTPCQLPREIEQKIGRFMKAIGHDTGSLDFIRTRDGRFVFLEVNPVGQLRMVSLPCNYFLERRIAQALANRNHEPAQTEAIPV